MKNLQSRKLQFCLFLNKSYRFFLDKKKTDKEFHKYRLISYNFDREFRNPEDIRKILKLALRK